MLPPDAITSWDVVNGAAILVLLTFTPAALAWLGAVLLSRPAAPPSERMPTESRNRSGTS